MKPQPIADTIRYEHVRATVAMLLARAIAEPAASGRIAQPAAEA